MKFIDHVFLNLKAGKGGNGAISFLHLKNNPKAGPDGGDGGDGGDIIFNVSKNFNTLFHLKNVKEIRAQNGENGSFKNKTGRNGANTIINVPIGCVVVQKKDNNEEILFNLDQEKQVLFLKGGKGGKGNKKFATSKNKTPYIFEVGKIGQEASINLELKLLSDVCLVGLANVGKSTLLNNLTNAKAQVQNYPFTTLVPNLGVVNVFENKSFVLADLPGLIKNASLGKGLGLFFLQHIERCKFIVFVLSLEPNFIDISTQFQILQTELKNYNFKLSKLPFLICLSKTDLENKNNNINEFIKQLPSNVKVIKVSSFTKYNLKYLKELIFKLWSNCKNNSILQDLIKEQLENKVNVFSSNQFIQNYFEVLKVNKNTWELKGELIKEIYLDFEKNHNFLLFNMKLRKIGVFNQLKKQKIKQNDVIRIQNYEFNWKE